MGKLVDKNSLLGLNVIVEVITFSNSEFSDIRAVTRASQTKLIATKVGKARNFKL